jgi:EAL domain-containing protein (putative c-di-GMP-specific phosphodiesterase class I)
MALARDLRAAAATNEGLAVWLQPQVDLAGGSVVGFEALMRWTHPVHGQVPPSEFIPIAESSSLICDLGLWILRESVMIAKRWIDAGGAPFEIAVNLSAAQIWQTRLEDDVAAILRESGLPAHLLCLELTESMLADHAEGRVRATLQALKALGVKLALDDFGTGYSSLGYLIQLPFDKLKVDRVFVAEAARSEKGRHVLEGIIALGHGLGMTVVAEGVETHEELEQLARFGCNEIQGYLIARPQPAPAALAFALQTLLRQRGALKAAGTRSQPAGDARPRQVAAS